MKTTKITGKGKMDQVLVLCIGLGLFISTAAIAQDIHFSQFDETPLQLNPANAGVHHDVRAITNYRNQWQAVGSPYKTFAASCEFKLLKDKKNHLGIGIDFFNDKAGDAQLGSNQANLSLSGIVPLSSKSLLSGGLMCGFAQRSMKFDNLTWGNQFNGMSYDANLATGEPTNGGSFTYLDLGAGVQYSYGTDEMYISANNARKVNIGFSVFHPHQPVYSFYGSTSQNLHMKMVFHGAAALGLKNTPLILKPSYIVFVQGGTREITPGLTIQYVLQEGSKYTRNKNPAAFSLGGYYRTMDAFIATAKFEFSNYAIGFSYDVNLSKLRTITSTKGGFEISLRFIAPGAFGASRARI
ncbi:MAG: PorP/SprF family type IX secretion system membrane protein [Bacteroidia bacterium]|nr:PorP/SprF family type IX secretion system membrane protein [Bacteroidia bacterium]